MWFSEGWFRRSIQGKEVDRLLYGKKNLKKYKKWRGIFFFLLSFLQRRGQSACRGRTDLLRWPTNKEIKYTLAHQGQQNEYNFSQDICPSNFANHCIRVSKIYHNLLIVAPIISELRLFLQLSWIL